MTRLSTDTSVVIIDIAVAILSIDIATDRIIEIIVVGIVVQREATDAVGRMFALKFDGRLGDDIIHFIEDFTVDLLLRRISFVLVIVIITVVVSIGVHE